MRREFYLVAGVCLLIVGTLLFVNSFHSITGLVIIDNADEIDSRFAGIYFIFAGIFSLLLSKKRIVKGQAAMEFLMTYGWAILVSIITLGVLAFFGIFNPGSLAGSTAILNPPFYMNAWRVTSSEIVFEIQNAGPESYVISKANINFDGGICTSGALIEQINSGSTAVIIIPCSLEAKKSFSGDIEIEYTKSSSQLTQTIYGTIKDKVLPATSITSYSLTITIIGSGTVTCNGGECNPTYEPDTAIDIAAYPDSGYEFAGWSGDECDGELGNCVISINRNMSITATFNEAGVI